ncbi:MAG: hypothetical protein M0R06_12370 [Sphaerochaeta sp.]|jgi:hypothetical protein|nr:hypothetical protein [Sphaerochaeta sp.]
MSTQRLPEILNIVGHMSAVKPAVAAATAGACSLVADVAISTLSAGVLTIAAQNDYPRTVRGILTDANASITGATVTIFGLDQNGEGISDVLTFTGAGTVDGVKAFSKITSATWALTAGTVTTTDDTIALGYGPALGLPAAPGVVYDRLIKGTFDGGDEAGTFSSTYGLYTPAGTMDGAKAVEVDFLYKIFLKGRLSD